MTQRRFSPLWNIDEHDQSCFIVRDNNGQALANIGAGGVKRKAPGQREPGLKLTISLCSTGSVGIRTPGSAGVKRK
jgi:hypothetical protein